MITFVTQIIENEWQKQKTDRDKQNKKQNDKQYKQKLQKIHRKIIKTQIKKKKVE